MKDWWTRLLYRLGLRKPPQRGGSGMVVVVEHYTDPAATYTYTVGAAGIRGSGSATSSSARSG